MVIIRFLVLLFNVVVITLLVYRMLQLSKQDVAPSKKWLIWVAGTLLLIAPLAIIFRIIPFSMMFLLAYPVAVSLFIYFIREEQGS
jgi:hypothetical protein